MSTQNQYILQLEIFNSMAILSWIKLAFELMDSVKQFSLSNVGGHHPIRWSEQNTHLEEGRIHSCLRGNIELIFLTLSSPDSPAFRTGLYYITGFPGSPVCRQQIVIYNYVIQCIRINLFIYLDL